MSTKKKTVKKAVKRKAPAKKSAKSEINELKPFKTFGITRIDQNERSNHGYYVRVDGTAKWFSDKKNGGKKKALVAATILRDQLYAKLPVHRRARAAKKHAYSPATL